MRTFTSRTSTVYHQILHLRWIHHRLTPAFHFQRQRSSREMHIDRSSISECICSFNSCRVVGVTVDLRLWWTGVLGLFHWIVAQILKFAVLCRLIWLRNLVIVTILSLNRSAIYVIWMVQLLFLLEEFPSCIDGGSRLGTSSKWEIRNGKTVRDSSRWVLHFRALTLFRANGLQFLTLEYGSATNAGQY